MKICVIGVYFGKFPHYIDLWTRSCECNPEVDFLVVGDAELPYLPSNVRYLKMTLEEFKVLIEKKTQMSVKLSTGFKCCDYKPLYGHIFSELISEYDYWGFCDFDMLFGDILSFSKQYGISCYDKFLELGHLCLMRNSEEMRLLPMDKEIFPEVATTDKTTQFDELRGINTIINKTGHSMFTKRIFADVSRLWKRIKLAEKYPGSTDKNHKHQLFYWNNGKVFRAYVENGAIKTEEYIYIHLKKRKYGFSNCNASEINTIFITPDKLECSSDKTPEITKNRIYSMNKYHGRLYELIEEKFLSRNINHIVPKGR